MWKIRYARSENTWSEVLENSLNLTILKCHSVCGKVLCSVLSYWVSGLDEHRSYYWDFDSCHSPSKDEYSLSRLLSGGFVVAPLNKYFTDFGLRPLYYITAGIQLLAYAIAGITPFLLFKIYIYSSVLTVPNLSTAKPTVESAFFEPKWGLSTRIYLNHKTETLNHEKEPFSLTWVCLTAFLLGLVDSTNAASSSVVCSRYYAPGQTLKIYLKIMLSIYYRLLPGRASHTYSACRFYRVFLFIEV